MLSMMLTRGLVWTASSLLLPPSHKTYVSIYIQKTILNISTQYKRKPLDIYRFQGLQARNLTRLHSQKAIMGSSYLSNRHTHMLRTFPPSNNAAIPCTSCFFPCNNVKVVRNLGFKMDSPSHAYASCVVDHQRKDNNNKGFVMGCASWSLVSELERELEAEILNSEEANEGEGMGRFRHKCGERKGVVELLECLESEAIMGEDVGKEPMDYNRRAQIFDKSSRVFQALKGLNHE